MKILLLITEMGSGGAERQLSGLASMLTGRGHETRVCWMQGENFYSDALSEASVPELCLNASSRIMRMMKTAREIRRFHPDTVIAFLDGAISSALRVRKFFPWLRFRLIVSERNVTQNFTPEQNAKFRAYRRADAIVCNSFTQTENLRRRFPELAGRIATITNFVDLERFRPAEEENRNAGGSTEEVRGSGEGVGSKTQGDEAIGKVRGPEDSSNGAKAEVLKIAVVARIAAQKNVRRFTRAAALAPENLEIDWYGASAGPAPEDSPRVHFHPAQKNIENIYRHCDALCLPSLYEGFPNVVCEAMASGLPVLCSRVCDNPRLVKDGENGLLFDPLSERSIADALARFASLGAATRAAFGRESRRRAESLLSPEVFLESWEKLL